MMNENTDENVPKVGMVLHETLVLVKQEKIGQWQELTTLRTGMLAG